MLPATTTAKATALAAALAALSAPVLAEVPKVVTDIPAVHALAASVMGDLGTPTLLLDRGASPHSFQLRPSQAQALAEADLVLWVGADLTPWLDRAVRASAGKADVVALLDAPGTFRRAHGATAAEAQRDHADHDNATKATAAKDDGHDHGQGHDHAAPAAAEAGADDEHGHDHDGVDAHAWLDPANGKYWLTLIAAELSHHDGANAATYTANAAAAAARIDAADAANATLLAPVLGRPFVVFHDAYGYFTDHYGLTVAGSVALGDASAPGAGRIDALRATLRDGAVVCAFPEAQHDPRLIATVVEGTGTRIGATLDPSGSSMAPGPQLYEALLTTLAASLAECLGQPS